MTSYIILANPPKFFIKIDVLRGPLCASRAMTPPLKLDFPVWETGGGVGGAEDSQGWGPTRGDPVVGDACPCVLVRTHRMSAPERESQCKL